MVKRSEACTVQKGVSVGESRAVVKAIFLGVLWK